MYAIYTSQCILNKLSEYVYFTCQKTLLHTLFRLLLKSWKAFSVSLSQLTKFFRSVSIIVISMKHLHHHQSDIPYAIRQEKICNHLWKYSLRSARYDLNQLFFMPHTQYWSSFTRIIWWSTVSKAFWWSTNIPQPTFFGSRACLIFSVRYNYAWVVEEFCLKLKCSS